MYYAFTNIILIPSKNRKRAKILSLIGLGLIITSSLICYNDLSLFIGNLFKFSVESWLTIGACLIMFSFIYSYCKPQSEQKFEEGSEESKNDLH